MAKITRAGKCNALFDGMCWPIPCETLGDIEWRLRYSEPTKSDRLVAASVISAYQELLSKPRTCRERIVGKIRKASKLPEPEAFNG